MPPPKPSRQPQNTTEQSQLTAAAPVSTYIVAQSPEVLAQLLKDNQARGVCPSVYTTPASPFNTLAVQFQDEDQVLTTAVVSDLPFFDPALSEPSVTHDTQSGDSTLSDTNLDSLDSADNAPLMSSLSISDTAQTQSPAANRKQQKVKEMQNLYAVSSKVVGSVTGDLYSPVQKFPASSSAMAAAGGAATATGNACGPEIYGPVASFTQSSAIVGNLSQSASVGGNYGENPGNFGPSSLNSVVIPCSNQAQFVSGSHVQSQPVGYGNFAAATNSTSQIFAGGQSTSQNASGVQQSVVNSSSSSSSNSSNSSGGSGGVGGGGVGGGGGGSGGCVSSGGGSSSSSVNAVVAAAAGVVYPRNISSAGATSSASSAECLYGPVLKFRAQNVQPAGPVELKPVNASAGNYGQTGRSNLVYSPTPAQSLQSAYPPNYPHQQIYSNIAQPGQQAMYLPQMQHVQNIARQNAVPQAVSYAVIQHTANQQQSQLAGPNPIYTAHATSVSVVQAQKMHLPSYAQQMPAGIAGQSTACQVTGSNQPASLPIMQTSSIQSHFMTPSAVISQSVHPIPSGYIVDQQQPSSLGPIDHTQMHVSAVGNIMTSSVAGAHQQQQIAQPQMASGVAKTANVPLMATGVAKITTFVAQKQDEQLTSSTDGTLSGSLISSAVSDSTMSSSSSMTEEAQQDQV